MKIRKIKRILLVDVLIIAAIISMYALVRCQKQDAFTNKGEYESLSLKGTWYKVDIDTIYVMKMTGDGKYNLTDMSGNDIKSGKYDIGNHALKLDDEVFEMNYVDEADELKEVIKGDLSEYELREYFYTVDDNANKIYYFSNQTAAADQVQENCLTNEYFEKLGLFDDDGFAVDKDGNLLAYIGNKEEITIPEKVKVISENAMSSDYSRALKIKKVIIPKSVKKIDSWSFAFSNVEDIVIEQGVEEIKNFAFSDSNIKEIYFPKSVNILEPDIFNSEQSVDKLKIYCHKGSNVDTYFKSHPLSGNYEVIYNK